MYTYILKYHVTGLRMHVDPGLGPSACEVYINVYIPLPIVMRYEPSWYHMYGQKPQTIAIIVAHMHFAETFPTPPFPTNANAMSL